MVRIWTERLPNARCAHSGTEFVITTIPPFCEHCRQVAERVTGKEIYPHRPDLYSKIMCRCAPCAAHVGCHPGTDNALGRPCNEEWRKARIRAHAAFDPLWKGGGVRRREAYAWLADKLGIRRDKAHIGWFDPATCELVVKHCAEREVV